jgi:hypothetical protein
LVQQRSTERSAVTSDLHERRSSDSGCELETSILALVTGRSDRRRHNASAFIGTDTIIAFVSI